jgi:hypothetical protein
MFVTCSSGAFARGIVPAAAPFSSCAQVNARYLHGVGLVEARDRTSGTPVTTFTRSDQLYALAVSLDSDHDGIACEHS